MKIDVRQLERPVPDAEERPLNSEGEMSPEIRKLIRSFGGTDPLSDDDSEEASHLASPGT